MNMIKRFLFVALLMMATVSLSAQEVNKEDYCIAYGQVIGSKSIENLQYLAFVDAYNRLYNLLREQSEHLIDVYVEKYGCSELVKNQMKKHWLKVWVVAMKEVEVVDKTTFETKDVRDDEIVVNNKVSIEAGVSKSKFSDILDSIGNSFSSNDENELKKEQGALEQYKAGNKFLVDYWKSIYKLKEL